MAAKTRNEMIIKVSFDFSQLEALFAEYVASRPDDDGEAIVGASYQEAAQDMVDDFMAWLKQRPARGLREA